jgi:hypothetical protein
MLQKNNMSDLAAKLFSLCFKEKYHEHEYSDRTHTGNCDRGINFVGTEVFKLFRSSVFDRRGHLGADAPRYHHVRIET